MVVAPGGIPVDCYDCKISTTANVIVGATRRGLAVVSSTVGKSAPFASSVTVAPELVANGPSGFVLDVTSKLTADTCLHLKVCSSNEGCDVITNTVGSLAGGSSHGTVLRPLPSLVVATHSSVGAVVICT